MDITPAYGEATLGDLLDAFKKQVMLSMNCHALGTIQSFNATTQKAVVSIAYPKTYYKKTAAGTPGLVNEPYPALIDCPIVIMSGGATYLTFPIKSGDPCLVLFNDRDMDNWITSAQANQPVATARLHAFADAIALVGVKPFNNAISGYDTVRALLSNGTVSLGINPATGKVTIQNQASGTLNTTMQSILTQLQNLCTALAALTVSGVTSGSSASGPPVNAATISAVGTQLGTLATTLGGLLE